jgi:hypothetical protein
MPTLAPSILALPELRREWLGREDSNLENRPKRCGVDFPLLFANCDDRNAAE